MTDDQLDFATDFPHPGGLPEPVPYVRVLDDLSDDDQRKSMSGNLDGFLGIDV